MKKAEEKSTTSTQKRDAQNNSYSINYTHNLMVAQEAQEVNDLKIDPKFRDMIPKLTDDEFSQLEKNILADGRIKEPIVVWNGTIIDGHHRFYIALMHPEIQYETEERHFENEWAAMAWACNNQLGRRNLSHKMYAYLVGKRYDAEEMAKGGTGANKYSKEQMGNDSPSVKIRTSKRIGDEYGLDEKTVRNDGRFYKGVEEAEQIMPGIKAKILNDDEKVPQKLIEKIPNANKKAKESAVKAISSGEYADAKNILNNDSDILSAYGLKDDGNAVKFSADDLMQELTINFNKSIESLRTSIEVHNELLIDNREYIIAGLSQMFETEIKKFMEEI